jgi:tetrahydromethanopterin S-methyltransferase subunit F
MTLRPTHSCGSAFGFLRALLDHTTWIFLELSRPGILGGNDAHDLISKLREESTLIRFSHVVANHVPRGTPFHRKILFLDPITYEIVSDIQVIRLRELMVLFLHNFRNKKNKKKNKTKKDNNDKDKNRVASANDKSSALFARNWRVEATELLAQIKGCIVGNIRAVLVVDTGSVIFLVFLLSFGLPFSSSVRLANQNLQSCFFTGEEEQHAASRLCSRISCKAFWVYHIE